MPHAARDEHPQESAGQSPRSSIKAKNAAKFSSSARKENNLYLSERLATYFVDNRRTPSYMRPTTEAAAEERMRIILEDFDYRMNGR